MRVVDKVKAELKVADAQEEEALEKLKVAWSDAPGRARERFVIWVNAELAKQREVRAADAPAQPAGEGAWPEAPVVDIETQVREDQDGEVFSAGPNGATGAGATSED